MTELILAKLPMLAGWAFFIGSEAIAVFPKLESNSFTQLAGLLLKAAGAKKMLFVFLVMFTLSGCVTTPYRLPEVCQNGADSRILEVIKDPGLTSKVLLTTQVIALKSLDNYTKLEAAKFLDSIDEFLSLGTMTYLELVPYILNEINRANNQLGIALFIVGDDLELMSKDIPITPCDIALMRVQLAKQRTLLLFY